MTPEQHTHCQLAMCRTAVKEPLAIGHVLLRNGNVVKGFVGEAHSVQGKRDISDFESWRIYQQQRDA